MKSDRLCQVTVADSAGGRHTMEVEASSLYEAVFAYNSNQICHRSQYPACPKLLPETQIEVQAPDGRIFKTTFVKARDWANRAAGV